MDGCQRIPDTRNPYRPKLTLKKKGKRTIAYGSTFEIKDVLKVSSPYASASALLETLSVRGSVNTKKAETYKVSCTITDPCTAVSVTKTFKFKVGKKPVNTTTEVKIPEKDSTQIKTQK